MLNLVVLAAGAGSRFGGPKQVTAVDDAGHTLADYAVYDAIRAGFGRVVVVVKPDSDDAFVNHLRAGAGRHTDLVTVPQRLNALPDGFRVPPGRAKPWGTAHAVWCAAPAITGPFATVNADDFYGPTAFASLADFLAEDAPARHALVAYELRNTLSPSGPVARGICHTDEAGQLVSITERTRIVETSDGRIVAQSGQDVTPLPPATPVSLNLWGFHHDVLDEFAGGLVDFLTHTMPAHPLDSEWFLPDVVNGLLTTGRATVRVLPTRERWHGVTYADDLPPVRDAVRALREAGAYPEKLWA